jgi:hypothetical protein
MSTILRSCPFFSAQPTSAAPLNGQWMVVNLTRDCEPRGPVFFGTEAEAEEVMNGLNNKAQADYTKSDLDSVIADIRAGR